MAPSGRRALAVGLAAAAVLAGQLGLWLFARYEGGVLGPVDYLAETSSARPAPVPGCGRGWPPVSALQFRRPTEPTIRRSSTSWTSGGAAAGCEPCCRASGSATSAGRRGSPKMMPVGSSGSSSGSSALIIPRSRTRTWSRRARTTGDTASDGRCTSSSSTMHWSPAPGIPPSRGRTIASRSISTGTLGSGSMTDRGRRRSTASPPIPTTTGRRGPRRAHPSWTAHPQRRAEPAASGGVVGPSTLDWRPP